MSTDPFGFPEDPNRPTPGRPSAGGGPSFPVNPYAATVNTSQTEGFEEDVESFRRKYLKHEASIQSIGLLYMIPGVLILVFGVIFLGMMAFSFLTGNQGNPAQVPIGTSLLVAGIYGVLGGLQFYMGWALRRFKHGAKLAVNVFSVLGLIGFPIGTLISAYILYLLNSEKGKVVFSDAYQEAIRQTPHIKYKTSIIVVVFVVIVVALLAIGVVGAVIGG